MRSKLFLCAAAGALTLGLASCDEDNDQLIDLERNDEQLLVASNTTAKLVKIQTADLDDVERVDITVPYSDVDGIGLRGDDLFAADRTNDRLRLFADVFDDDNEEDVRLEATFNEAQIPNARGVAVNRDFTRSLVAVASVGDEDNDDDSDDDNRIFLLDAARADIETEAIVRVPFQLWGLEWIGDDLYAVMDGTDSVAVYEDFDDASSTGDTAVLEPTYKFRVEGLTRTHGITYGEDDILFLTDIGEAGSDRDGAIHVVPNFDIDAIQDEVRAGTLPLGRQIRIAGASTFLGNPVDVAYDDDNNNLFVAERARDGGRLIAFDMNEISDLAGETVAREVIFNEEVAGASSVEYRD